MSSRYKALQSCLPRTEYACYSVYRLVYRKSINWTSIRNVTISLRQYRCRSDVNRISFHKAVVSMKSNNPSIKQWYLLPTFSPFPFPTSSIYCFLSLHIEWNPHKPIDYLKIKRYFSTMYYRKAAALKQNARSRSRYILLLSSTFFIRTLAWGIRHV